MYVSETAFELPRRDSPGARAALRRLIAAADPFELRIVLRCVAFADRWRLQAAARLITRLGNGWLYPIAAALLLITSFQSALRGVFAAAISLAIAFSIYPPLKRLLARRRPCDHAPRMIAAPEPLDRYACPSGHAMTAAAFGVPIIFAARPNVAPVVIGGYLLVSWSRIALGHHYVSDIVAGTLIGGAIAYAVATFVV
jgi:undecaprenyl-diphosphatase